MAICIFFFNLLNVRRTKVEHKTAQNYASAEKHKKINTQI